MVKRIRIFIEYLAASIVILTLLLAIVSIIIVKFYGDEVQKYTMEIINHQLDTKLSADEIGISILKNFPNTSLFLKNTTLVSGENFKKEEFLQFSPDTLFFAKRIYMEFNMLDLFKKHYKIKGLEAYEGFCSILIDSQGNGNFLSKKSKDNQNNSAFLEVNGVTLKEIKTRYVNRAKDTQSEILLHDVIFQGRFARKNFMLKSKGSSYINLIRNKGVMYVSDQELVTDISLLVNNNKYLISKGEIMLGELTSEIIGEFLVTDEGLDLNLQMKGKKIDIGLLSAILSRKNPAITGFTGKGKIDFSAGITGLASPKVSPHIDAKFSANKGYLSINKVPVEMKLLSFDGSFTNGSLNNPATSIVDISSFNTYIGNSVISGSMNLKNILTPLFEITLRGEIAGTDIPEYLPELPVKITKGILYPRLSISGSIKNAKGKTKKVIFSPAGSVLVKDLFLRPGDSEFFLDSVNGILNISNRKLFAKLSGYIDHSDILIDVSSTNPFISNTKLSGIKIEGSAHSKNIYFDELIEDLGNKENKKNSKFDFPEKLVLNIDFAIDRLLTKDFETKEISGILNYIYPEISIDQLYLETMNGSLNSTILLSELQKPTHQLNISSSFKNIEISPLFKSFNNFGQDFISYTNIAGRISGKSEFISSFNTDFNLNTASIISENNINIENGELVNFLPLLELSRFLKIDEMDHIKFSTIKNTIFIKDKIISIPEMDIKSSAINIKAYGTHSFEKYYDYHLATKLSELLFNKAKKSAKGEFDIALDKEDHRTLFLHLFNAGNGMKVEYDEAQAINKIKQDLKEEKTELKEVLNEEFGLFRKDETKPEKQESKDNPAYIFEFPVDQPENILDTLPQEKLKWWKKKKESNKKPDVKFVIDDTDL